MAIYWENNHTSIDIFTDVNNSRGLANTTSRDMENSIKNIWVAIMHTNPSHY